MTKKFDYIITRNLLRLHHNSESNSESTAPTS